MQRCRAPRPSTASRSPTSATAPGRPWCCCTAGRARAATTTTSSRGWPTRPTWSCPTCAASASPTARRPAGDAYGAPGQAASVRALVAELELERPVLVGYDVGSRVAQEIARRRPRRCAGWCSRRPCRDRRPHPVARRRCASSGTSPSTSSRSPRSSWRSGRRRSARTCATSGRTGAPTGWEPPADELDRLVAAYSAPGAFAASINWYRAGAGAIARSLAETTPAPRGAHRAPDARAVGRPGAAVPARVGRPDRRVLRRRDARGAPGHRALHAARGARRHGRGRAPHPRAHLG